MEEKLIGIKTSDVRIHCATRSGATGLESGAVSVIAGFGICCLDIVDFVELGSTDLAVPHTEI